MDFSAYLSTFGPLLLLAPIIVCCKQFCNFVICCVKKEFQQLVLNLLSGGIMWSLSFCCLHSPCPSEIADLYHVCHLLPLFQSEEIWLTSFFFPLMRKRLYNSPYPIAFFFTFCVLTYLLSVTRSAHIIQRADPSQIYNTKSMIAILYFLIPLFFSCKIGSF